MRSPTSWTVRICVVALAFAAGARLEAQPNKLPAVDEVKALQAKYKEEHDAVVRSGAAKRFIPAIMDKADELAKKSAVALAAGRLLQASEAIRLARWQLPYQPGSVPEHVSRIIGNLRLRHSAKINAIAFSPDGTRLASASSDQTVKIWDLGNGHELLTYAGHTDEVGSLAWSSDGAFIVSAGHEKNIKIWDPKTGKEIRSIAGVGEFVSSIALSKDGKHLFTGQHARDPKVINGLFVYETQTGKLVRDLRDFPVKLDALALNHAGNILAVGDDNGDVRLFQYPAFIENANQPEYCKQQDPTGATYNLAFSPDDKTLVRVGPWEVKLYATPAPGAPFQVGTPRSIINVKSARRAVFSQDGKSVFIGDDAGNITRWSPDDAQMIADYKQAHNSPINQLVFSPGGDRLATCSGDYAIRMFDFDTVLPSRDFDGHEGPVWTAGFSPDATRLISASADKTVKVWQRDTGTVLFTIKDHTAPVTVALFSPDGKRIASAGGDKVVRIFDADNGKPLRICEGHQGTITFLDFSPDGKRIVSAGADRQIKIWDADTAKPIVSITDNPSIVSAVAFQPEGKQIAVGNIDQTIRLYDSAGKLQARWMAHGIAVNGLAYSPNGQWLASCGADNAVIVWPLATPGTNEIRLSGHDKPVSMVAFRKDNLHLVSCGADQLIKLWKIEGNAGKEVQTFRGHKDWVSSVAFSKDGYHLVSASVDRKLKMWEIASRDLPLLAEHTSAVEAVAVSPDGAIIATGSRDRTIKLWNRKTGEEMATLAGHAGPVASLVFTPDSKRVISAGAGGPGEREKKNGDAIRLWEISPPRETSRTPQQLATMSAFREKGYSQYIALDPEGKSLFVWIQGDSATVKTIVEVHDWQKGLIRFEFIEGSLGVHSFAFCANGKLCAAGSEAGLVRLWEMGDTGAKIAPGGDWSLFDKKIGVADLALTPDGSTLVATSAAGEIKIGKLQGRQILRAFKGHNGRILACIVSPDGKTIATVGADNLIKAWDMTGKELRRWDLGKHQGMFVINLAFSPDSKQIVTANANTTVYVLDLP